jgi:hypothetical protein
MLVRSAENNLPRPGRWCTVQVAYVRMFSGTVRTRDPADPDHARKVTAISVFADGSDGSDVTFRIEVELGSMPLAFFRAVEACSGSPGGRAWPGPDGSLWHRHRLDDDRAEGGVEFGGLRHPGRGDDVHGLGHGRRVD